MGCRSIMVGIAGDSAAGKTTLSQGIVKALGKDVVTGICSDNYHAYSRQTRKSLGISALSPEGNYLDIAEQHFRLLREGQPILMPVYNHSTGDFDLPRYIMPNKFVIIEGLLPFHTKRMRDCFDIMIYLDPPEKLRYAWKINRDTARRGYTQQQVLASLEKRNDLSPKYIYPQRSKADIVVRFHPPEDNPQETGGGLNACLALLPTIPRPDLNDLLQHSGNGNRAAISLELGSYLGKPADLLHIDGSVTAEKAAELEQIINNHLPPDAHLQTEMLGVFQSGLELRRSYPLALTQLLITNQMITAVDAVQV